MTVIHEFSSPVWVITPLGEGRAIVMIDYGIDHNPVFLVQLDSGLFKCVDTNDCRSQENLMLGVRKPAPPMPEPTPEDIERLLRRHPGVA